MQNRILLYTLAVLFFLAGCNRHNSNEVQTEHIIEKSKDMPAAISGILSGLVSQAMENQGRISDSLKLDFTEAVNAYYQANAYHPVWTDTMAWRPMADSLMTFISNSLGEGLFPGDYHCRELDSLRKIGRAHV